MVDQITFGAASFADNPEPRVPCVLLLDTSQSMEGDPIRHLNDGIAQYRNDLMADSLAAKRVELSIVTFGPVTVVQDFTTVDAFTPPPLSASGNTPLGAAIEKGIELLAGRKRMYREAGIAFYRPWIWLITDGAPTDAWQHAAELVKQGEARKEFSFFAVGVANADFGVLAQLSAARQPLQLKGLSFREMFQWLSNSQQSVSRSSPADVNAVPLTDPTAGPRGWAVI